jgi:hypothetical protein
MTNIYSNHKRIWLIVSILFFTLFSAKLYSQRVDVKVSADTTGVSSSTVSVNIKIVQGNPPFSIAIFNGNPGKNGKLLYKNGNFDGLTFKQTLDRYLLYYIIVYSVADEDASVRILKL